METVKRLAARVRTTSTNHDKSPSRVRKGSLTVAIKPKQTNNNPIVEMLIRSAVLGQFFFSVILILVRCWSEVLEAAAERLGFSVLLIRGRSENVECFRGADQRWQSANIVEPSKDNLSVA